MELKNADSNGWNDVINNLHPMILFFSKKYWKLSKIKDFKVYFRVDKTPHNFWFIDQNRMIQSFPHIYNSRKPISFILFLKEVTFLNAQIFYTTKKCMLIL